MFKFGKLIGYYCNQKNSKIYLFSKEEIIKKYYLCFLEF